MFKKIIAALVVAAGVAAGGYWYYSPYLVMRATQEAASKRDADAFNARVDYPKVRESFKGQMGALVTERLGQSQSGAESFGAMLGLALVNQMVEAFMRPEVVMRAMQEGKIKPPPGGNAQNTQGPGSETREEVDWTFERPTMDKAIAYARKPGQSVDEPVLGFVFERSGFADWKLTEIRLPMRK